MSGDEYDENHEYFDEEGVIINFTQQFSVPPAPAQDSTIDLTSQNLNVQAPNAKDSDVEIIPDPVQSGKSAAEIPE